MKNKTRKCRTNEDLHLRKTKSQRKSLFILERTNET